MSTEPVGKYPDLSSCILDHVQNRGKSEPIARKICNTMKVMLERNENVLKNASADELKDLVEERKVYAYEGPGGKVYLNVFLVDETENWNGWGIRPTSIPQYIQTARGKPMVAYLNAQGKPDHPMTGGESNLEHVKAYQKLFQIGEFEHVYESRKHPGRWYGVAKITDHNAERAFRENPTAPIFVSPQIHHKDLTEPDNDVTQWEFMHAAIVNVPAYGVDRAYISGVCSGDGNTCLMKLKDAAIKQHVEVEGKPACGFCTYEFIKTLQANIQSKLSNDTKNVSSHSNGKQLDNLDTSLSSNANTTTEIPLAKTTNETNTAPQQNTGSTTNNTTNNKSLSNEEIEKQIEEMTKKYAQHYNTTASFNKEAVDPSKSITVEKKVEKTVSNDNTNSNTENKTQEQQQPNSDVNKELVSRNENLVTQLQATKFQLENELNAKEAMKQIMLQQNERIASLEQDRKDREKQDTLNRIKNFVYNSPAYRDLNTDQKDKQVQILLQSGLPLEQMEQILQPMVNSLKKASLNKVGFNSRFSLARDDTEEIVNTTAPTSIDSPELKSASAKRRNLADDDADDWFSLSQMMFSGSSNNGGGI